VKIIEITKMLSTLSDFSTTYPARYLPTAVASSFTRPSTGSTASPRPKILCS